MTSPLKINVLPAAHGDSILLSFRDESGIARNVLVDGGPGITYSERRGRGPGVLKNIVTGLRASRQMIDLLVLTHIDNDHIGGLLAWFEDDPDAHSLIGEVWFNSAQLIAEQLGKEIKVDRSLPFNPSGSILTSVREGSKFEDHIAEKGIWNRNLARSGDISKIHGLEITILSPDDLGLAALEQKWTAELPPVETGGRLNDYSVSVAAHLDSDVFREDQAVHNQSSIAMLVRHNDSNLLLLADAHPSTVIKSLRELGYSEANPLPARLVKLSHHGSKGNTNTELLSLLDATDYIISSNGAIHNLPDKQCLSRIIGVVPEATFHFNYEEMTETIFTQDDRAMFPDFKTRFISGPLDV